MFLKWLNNFMFPVLIHGGLAQTRYILRTMDLIISIIILHMYMELSSLKKYWQIHYHFCSLTLHTYRHTQAHTHTKPC